MLRRAGVKEIHMRISCPPTISPCYYGVDTPNKSELIAANMSIEEIRKHIGADSLGFLSVEGLNAATRQSASNLCNACFTGRYPIDVQMHLDQSKLSGRRPMFAGADRVNLVVGA